jgi:RecA/RadA recombinase
MATKKPIKKPVAAKKAPAKKAMEVTIKEAPLRKTKGRAKPVADDVEEAIEEAVGTKRKGKAGLDTTKFDVKSLYASTVDEVARKQDFDSDLLEDTPPMSTGILMLDLIEGGGIRPAWYTHFGPEQSCKTTGALTIMAAAIQAEVPIIALADYEGSTRNSRPYVGNILKTSGLKVSIKDVFGKKDPNTGKWLIEPLVRYRSETLGEKFFDYMADLLRKLPDKKFIAGKWWLVFDDDKANKAKLGDHIVPSMAKKYGKGLWVEAPDGNLQALVLVDSYPAMNPTANDDDDANNSLALQARMFSKHLPRVKGRMAAKMVAVIGINQLRAVPMAMYGPKETEPGGVALKFNSDVRIQWTPIGSNLPFIPKFDADDRLEHELSVTGSGKDRYRYIRMKAIKNKLWTPGRKGFVRLWVEDGTGEARGFDPFFDTVMYLKETGQLKGSSSRKPFQLDLDGFGKAKKPVSWMTLKQWVLGTKEEKVKICTTLGYKPLDLRKYCFKQMSTGKAEELFVALRGSNTKIADDEGDE